MRAQESDYLRAADRLVTALEDVIESASAASLRLRVREALDRYHERLRCHGHRMMRCKLDSGHAGQCSYIADISSPLPPVPERAWDAGEHYSPCPGFSGECPQAGLWGATGVMPGHIWQWRNNLHTSGYLAHIPEWQPAESPWAE